MITSRSAEPDRTLVRWETLLSRTSSAINLFRLLEARPGLFQLLVDCPTLAPPLADELARRPDLLDTLIDRSAFDLPGSVEELAAAMGHCERGDDTSASWIASARHRRNSLCTAWH